MPFYLKQKLNFNFTYLNPVTFTYMNATIFCPVFVIKNINNLILLPFEVTIFITMWWLCFEIF